MVTPSDQDGKRAAFILGIGVLAVVLYLGLLHLTGWRAEIGESNFQTNLIKLQNLEQVADPTLVLTGSSLTGRLLESYFPVDPVVNLGLDGCNTTFALSQLLQNDHRPEVVLMEANSLLTRRLENEESLTDARQRLEFKLAGFLPSFRAENRPSSVLYDRLKKGRGGPRSPSVPIVGISLEANAVASDLLTPEDQSMVARLSKLVAELQEKGARCVWMMLPDNRFDQVPRAREYAVMRAVAASTGAGILDLKRALPGDKVTYTDGLHLAPESARLVVEGLTSALFPEAPRP
ncbi:MAG: hypothetical protein AAF514_02805 [Verrucomicrobiota bacterium]